MITEKYGLQTFEDSDLADLPNYSKTMNDAIIKVLDENELIENERTKAEENRVNNEKVRTEAETSREEYITNLKKQVDNGDFKGDPNVLTVGTVESGEKASATITGDSPNQKLNLVLPEGPKGDKGDTPVEKHYKIDLVAGLSPGENLELPASYKVGSNNLKVYFEGCLLEKDINYQEVGSNGETSNQILIDWGETIDVSSQFSITITE